MAKLVKQKMELFILVILVVSATLISGRDLVMDIPDGGRMNRQPQLREVEFVKGVSPKLVGVGCFSESNPRALRDFLGSSSSKTPRYIIKDCAAKAVNKGYVYFGVQGGSECWGDDQSFQRYDMYGGANNCVNELGSISSNYVHKITEIDGYCVTHNKLYKYNSLVIKDDPCKTCKCSQSNGKFHVICQHKKCPLLPRNCEKVITRPGECCPVCECFHANTHHKNGESWWWAIGNHACEQCSCDNNQASCELKPCPVCSSYVHKPGQCCRACATQEPITFTILPTTENVETLPTPPSHYAWYR